MPRALQFSLNDVGMDAVRRFRDRMPAVLDRPNPWTLKGLQYDVDKDLLNSIWSIGEARASVYLDGPQSVSLKYLFGYGAQTRQPGDVGLAAESIYVPFGDNIKLTQGVSPNKYGNVPQGFMRRLKRETLGLSVGMSTSAGAARNRASRAGKRRSVYEGSIKIKGTMVQAIMARSHRKPDRHKNSFANGAWRVVNVPKMRDQDVPRVLFLKAEHAEYEPMLQRP